MKNTKSSLKLAVMAGVLLLQLSYPGTLSAWEKNGAFQEPKVSGTVTDSNGEALPGASILIKGTNSGTVTDADGKYSLNVPNENATLIFSFIGHESQEVSLNGRRVLDIALAADVSELSEVVVVGYGTEKKKDLTGSIVSVKSKDFNAGIALAPEQLIQGKVAGVNIVQNSGQPGAASTVRIRGSSSISAGNDPLYVVDGVPLNFTTANLFVTSNVGGTSPFSSERANPLNVINPADIESIDILKDASATAIYGSRGANGVIVITTKSKQQMGSFTYDTYVSLSSVRKKLPVLSADQFREFANQNGQAFPDEGADTDWQDEIFQTGISQNHNVSFGGSNTTSNYRASIGYNGQEGIIRSSGIEKYTGRLNAQHKAIDGRLRIGLNMTYAKTETDNAPVSSNINNEGGNLLKDALRWAPTLPVRNPDGSFYQIGELRVNPVSWADQVIDEGKNSMLLGNVNTQLDLFAGLTLQVNLGHTEEFVERFTNIPNTHPAAEAQSGRASISKLKNTSSLIETSLLYQKDLNNNSNISFLVGYSFQRFLSENTFTLANQFVSSEVDWNLIQSGSILANQSNKQGSRLASFYGRVNYKLQDKYIITGTIRRDGSSRFGPNYRWGVFPSGAVAWRISEEAFFPTTIINDMKLRVGYGVTGNQEIPNYLYMEQLTVSGTDTYTLGGLAVPSVLPSNYANPDLKWEQSTQLNIGMDFTLLTGVISGIIDVYTKSTDDLLLEFSTAAPSVVTTQWANVGKVENKGIEVTLNAQVISRDQFQWSVSGNFSHNRNEVVALSNDQFEREYFDVAPLSGVVGSDGSTQRIIPGQPLGTFWGLKFTGFDAEGDETYETDQDGEPLQMAIGNANPDFTYGFSSTFQWKKFDASFTARGVVGNVIFNNTEAEFSYRSSFPGINVLESTLTTEANALQVPQYSSRWLQDGGYLRLDNVNIGYRFNTSGIDFLQSARIYITGQNLFVITSYTGFDPEVRTNTNRDNTPAIGIDYLSYPRPRVFMLGASVTF